MRGPYVCYDKLKEICNVEKSGNDNCRSDCSDHHRRHRHGNATDHLFRADDDSDGNAGYDAHMVHQGVDVDHD